MSEPGNKYDDTYVVGAEDSIFSSVSFPASRITYIVIFRVPSLALPPAIKPRYPKFQKEIEQLILSSFICILYLEYRGNKPHRLYLYLESTNTPVTREESLRTWRKGVPGKTTEKVHY